MTPVQLLVTLLTLLGLERQARTGDRISCQWTPQTPYRPQQCISEQCYNTKRRNTGTIIHTEQYYNTQAPRQIQLTIMHPCFWPFLKTKIKTNTLNTKSQVVNGPHTAHNNAFVQLTISEGYQDCHCMLLYIYTKRTNNITLKLVLNCSDGLANSQW